MSKVRVSAFAVSLDGYSAGPRQSLDNPLGVCGPGGALNLTSYTTFRGRICPRLRDSLQGLPFKSEWLLTFAEGQFVFARNKSHLPFRGKVA
jgi:hypothetical protein